jgi:thioredoxin reductase
VWLTNQTTQAHAPDVEINGPFVEQLGLELAPSGEIKTNQPFNETSVPGVFAAGDCATMMRAVTTATMAGSMAAVGASGQIQREDLYS